MIFFVPWRRIAVWTISVASFVVFVFLIVLAIIKLPAPPSPLPPSTMTLVESNKYTNVYRDTKRKVICWEFARGVWCTEEYIIEERERWEREQAGH